MEQRLYIPLTNNVSKSNQPWPNKLILAKYGTREMGFGLLDSTVDGEHNGVVFVKISKIFLM